MRPYLLNRFNFVCQGCGHFDPTGETLETDHINPIERGGNNDVKNLQILCGTCNRSKGTKTMEEWEWDKNK